MSHRLAQRPGNGSGDKPAAIGLDLMRSSRRASASSAAASTPKRHPAEANPRRAERAGEGHASSAATSIATLGRGPREDPPSGAPSKNIRPPSAGDRSRRRSSDVDDPDFGDAEARVEGQLGPRS